MDITTTLLFSDAFNAYLDKVSIQESDIIVPIQESIPPVIHSGNHSTPQIANQQLGMLFYRVISAVRGTTTTILRYRLGISVADTSCVDVFYTFNQRNSELLIVINYLPVEIHPYLINTLSFTGNTH